MEPATKRAPKKQGDRRGNPGVSKPRPRKPAAVTIAYQNRRAKFIELYLTSFNGKQSAIGAGYSPASAGSIANSLLQKADVREEIKRRAREVLSDVEAATLEWYREVNLLANSDLSEILDFDDKGVSLKDSNKLTKEVLRTMESISFTTTNKGTSKSVKLHSKVKALELKGKFLAILNDNPPPPLDEGEAMDRATIRKRIAMLERKRQRGDVAPAKADKVRDDDATDGS
jgi:phage terminase small subunit